MLKEIASITAKQYEIIKWKSQFKILVIPTIKNFRCEQDKKNSTEPKNANNKANAGG